MVALGRDFPSQKNQGRQQKPSPQKKPDVDCSQHLISDDYRCQLAQYLNAKKGTEAI